MDCILRCHNLTKTFGRTIALNNLNLHLQPGRIIGLLGPNGSGKTTLLKTAAGLLTPTSGEIEICGHPVGIETKKIVSYLPDCTSLDEQQSARQIFDFFADFYQDFDLKKANDMLQTLQIDPSKRIKTMSKGTKEKLQIVLTMSRRAKVYLLDEPLGGVDPAARDFILETIIKNYTNDSTLVISTHLIQDIENYLDEVCFIQRGVQLLHTTTKDIYENQNTTVNELFREAFKC